MQQVRPYLAFAASLLVASIILEGLVAWAEAPLWTLWLIPSLASLVAVASGLRFGAMSAKGVFVTTAICLALLYSAIVAIYHWVAAPVGGSVGFADLFRVGGLQLGISIAVSLAAPLVWLFILTRRSAQHAPQAQS